MFCNGQMFRISDHYHGGYHSACFVMDICSGDLTIITGEYHTHRTCFVMDKCSGDLTIITGGYHSACFVMDKCSGISDHYHWWIS